MGDLISRSAALLYVNRCSTHWLNDWSTISVLAMLEKQPAVDAAPVVHGRWVLQAHKERSNCRWSVTAECSECCAEKKEIWAGFFPNIQDDVAQDVALISAEMVKLSNYCPNCGAKMDGGEE